MSNAPMVVLMVLYGAFCVGVAVYDWFNPWWIQP